MDHLLFNIKDLLQLLTIAFSFGVLVSTVRALSKTQKIYEAATKERMDKIEERQSEMEARSLVAIEKLSNNLTVAIEELKSIVARQETRLTVIEDRMKQ